MLRPSPISVSMAGMPSRVAGTFTKRLGRAMASWNFRASRTVPSVSWASVGDTSRET